MRTLYGPVDSWRFGRSLGVDPLAGREKRCPFSCIYCQYGSTQSHSFRRQRFVSAAQLRDDLRALGPVTADCVTFAGLGEPTLANNLPELVDTMREHLALPVLLLTGSALMPSGAVRRDLLGFDAVATKLDAPDESLFRWINRPGPGYPYGLEAIVNGIYHFRQAYTGRLILQMMFVQANIHAAAEMAALARSLTPDEVQLNTPLEPALGGPVTARQMQQIEKAFEGLPVRSVYVDGRAQARPRLL
jgi:wyosine [tRNA(Phe)-imidazoG37] synthetase (radical SAM superfamily)